MLDNNKQTGGPAFHVDTYDTELNKIIQSHGMTLRDYFAAKAMQGVVHRSVVDESMCAKWAYAMADAMLRAKALESE